MRNLYEFFMVLEIQKRIVSAETILGNPVLCNMIIDLMPPLQVQAL